MKEIGLGKELGDSPQENIVQFIGCVTTQSKKAILYFSFMPFIYSRYIHLFFSLFFSLFLCLFKKNNY